MDSHDAAAARLLASYDPEPFDSPDLIIAEQIPGPVLVVPNALWRWWLPWRSKTAHRFTSAGVRWISIREPTTLRVMLYEKPR